MAPTQKNQPEQSAIRLLNKLELREAPIPVDRIAKHLNAIIRYSPLDDEISGMIYIQDGTPIIGINSLHHPNRQRFSMAHEIGHLQLHREKLSGVIHVDKQFQLPVLRRDAISALGTDRMEVDANQFAAELLMPEAILEKVLGQRTTELDDEGLLDELAKTFKVSRQAMQHRITSLSIR